MEYQIAVVEKTDSTLTKIERSNFTELESTIEKHLNAFYEVGFALMQIRDNKYYRERYSTFELYCKERWGFSRPRAYQLIKSAEVHENLSTNVDISEGAIRPLTKIKDPDEQRKVYQKAVEKAPEGKITGRHIQETIDRQTNKDHGEADIGLPRISKSFKTALDHLEEEIECENRNGWKETDKQVAVQYIQKLLDMIMTNDIKTPIGVQDNLVGNHAS